MAGYSVEYVTAQIAQCPKEVSFTPKLLLSLLNVAWVPVSATIKVVDIVAGEDDVMSATRARRKGIYTCS